MPVLTLPLALLALAAVPALVAIYWLRNKFRRQTVSSLMLWLDQRRPREGGVRVQSIQTPLLFFLELAALVLLALAAARPMLPLPDAAIPVFVVLDDSYSMGAGGDESPRALAEQTLREELRRLPGFSLRLMLAGSNVQLLGPPVRSEGDVLPLLENWTCTAPAARIDRAVALAADMGTDDARVIVLTDRAPGSPQAKDQRIEWWAFGQRRANVAFVNAARTTREEQDRCLIEIANLSDQPQVTEFALETSADGGARVTRLDLGPRQIHRVFMTLSQNTTALAASLSDDALDMDNRLLLLPPPRRMVRARLSINDQDLHQLVRDALDASGRVLITDARPELLITDSPEAAPTPDGVWMLQILTAPADAQAAYLGPFVVNRAHPLTEGLGLNGVVWSADKVEDTPGAVVVTAGDVPLLTDTRLAGDNHLIRLKFNPTASNLQNSTDWPILFWNLLQWRSGRSPGLPQPNVRLGTETAVRLDPIVEKVIIERPDGNRIELPVHDGSVSLRADQPGLYTITAAGADYSLAANVLYRDESDLSAAITGRWGSAPAADQLPRHYRGAAWILVILALAILAAHQVLAGRAGGRRQDIGG